MRLGGLCTRGCDVAGSQLMLRLVEGIYSGFVMGEHGQENRVDPTASPPPRLTTCEGPFSRTCQ